MNWIQDGIFRCLPRLVEQFILYKQPKLVYNELLENARIITYCTDVVKYFVPNLSRKWMILKAVVYTIKFSIRI